MKSLVSPLSLPLPRFTSNLCLSALYYFILCAFFYIFPFSQLILFCLHPLLIYCHTKHPCLAAPQNVSSGNYCSGPEGGARAQKDVWNKQTKCSLFSTSVMKISQETQWVAVTFGECCIFASLARSFVKCPTTRLTSPRSSAPGQFSSANAMHRERAHL